jgi:hypothetical protein
VEAVATIARRAGNRGLLYGLGNAATLLLRSLQTNTDFCST